MLFLDEIQAAPEALAALRYFREEMPELHVVAAGSLLEFALGLQDSKELPDGAAISYRLLSLPLYLAGQARRLAAELLAT